MIDLGQIISKREFDKNYSINGYRLIDSVVKYDKKLNLNTLEGINTLLEYSKDRKYPFPLFRTKGLLYIGEGNFVTVKQPNFLLPIILLFLLLLLGISSLRGLDNNEFHIDPNIEDYEGSLVRPEEVSEAQTLIPGFPNLYMEANQNKLYVELVNPYDNPCYFKYTILLKETSEVIYSSKLIPPGKTINDITLDRNIDKGEYDVIIRINTYLLSDPEFPLNNSDVITKLYALE